jgi:phage protein D
MDLAALSADYGGFYAPAFFVRVDGADLMRTHLVAVSQVQVDLELGATGHFNFTVVDAYSFKDHRFLSGTGRPLRELLAFGAPVEICMGYGDARTVPVITRGVITEMSTSFPESGSPELSVSGHDNAFPLTNGKRSHTWSKSRDSDVVQQIARDYNLQAAVDTTPVQEAQTEQNQESDFAFIKKLADRNHFELFVDDSDRRSVLRFARPRDDASAVLTLAWGAGLLSFRPSANLAGQVGSVEVYGWDPQKLEPIVGRAGRNDLSGLAARQRSAGDLFAALAGGSGRQPVMRLRQPVFTQAEADTRARAALNENAKAFLTGDAESIGLPEIRPDRNVELASLGDPFSRTYYVQQATHKVDANGYRTRFKVKEAAL